MKISIVTISYNQAPFLRLCIDSVLSQTNVDLEYIIVDPGSTDGSREIIQSYGDRIIKVFESDSGPADGLNRGFAQATGDVFGFINSDDYLLPTALATIAAHFDNVAPNTFISGSGWIEYPDGDRRRVIPTQMQLDSYLYGACTVFQQGTFFPAKMFHYVRGFNTTNHTCWDGEFFADLLAAGFKHHVIDERIAVFRHYPESITGSQRLRDLYLCDKKRIFEKVKGRKYSSADTSAALWWRVKKIANRYLRKVAAMRLS